MNVNALKEQRLNEIFQTMNVPISRKKDFGWLLRNLGIGNSNHPDFQEAITIIKFLAKNQ